MRYNGSISPIIARLTGISRNIVRHIEKYVRLFRNSRAIYRRDYPTFARFIRTMGPIVAIIRQIVLDIPKYSRFIRDNIAIQCDKGATNTAIRRTISRYTAIKAYTQRL